MMNDLYMFISCNNDRNSKEDKNVQEVREYSHCRCPNSEKRLLDYEIGTSFQVQDELVLVISSFK